MLRKFTLILLLALIIAAGSIVTSDAAIVKVAKRLQVLEFYGGYSQPLGSYDRINNIPFYSQALNQLVELDAEDVYDPTYCFGFNYGQLRNNHILFSLGFRWTHINLADDLEFTVETPTLNQYDLDFNLNYYLTNPSRSILSPYAGIGFHGGINSLTGDLIQTENEVTLAIGINFGADLTIWKSPSDRSMVALSSANEWIFAASDERPKYLNIGAAVKYYFRP